jgi:histidine phosphotransferase ChpT
MSQDALGLGRLHVARICHDLGGIAGTLGATLDLVGGDDPATQDLLREAALALRQRLRLYAAAWGGAADAMDGAQLGLLLQGSPAVPRVGFDLQGLPADVALPAELVPLVLNVAMLGAEALPRGGTVHVSGDPGRGFTILPVGRSAAWPPGLLRGLAGIDPAALLEEGGPRRMLAPLLLMQVQEAGWTAALALAAPGTEGAAPLLLMPARPAR